MIEKFVAAWDARKGELRDKWAKKAPESYMEVVSGAVGLLSEGDEYSWDTPDPERIHEIDDGDYQGTLVYVIGAQGYQPSTYWVVAISYGSCSGCDTLQAISGYSGEPPTDEQLGEYMTLALHVIQGLKDISQ